jgi:hypothetical protein
VIFDPQKAIQAADARLRLIAHEPDETATEIIEAEDASLLFAGTDLPAPHILAFVEHAAHEEEVGPRRAQLLRVFWFAWELRGQAVPAVSANRRGWRARLAAIERDLTDGTDGGFPDGVYTALEAVRAMLDETP